MQTWTTNTGRERNLKLKGKNLNLRNLSMVKEEPKCVQEQSVTKD